MSWRTVVIRGPAKLDLKLGQMVVRQEKKHPGKSERNGGAAD